MNNRASLQLGGDNWAAKDANLLAYKTSLSEKNFLPIEFDFERGSNLAATRVDENGLIEKGRENLLVNSVWDGVTTDTKPTGWSAQSVTGTGTFDVTATEGQIRFTTSDVSSRSFIYTPSILINGILTVSVYVDQVYTTCPINQVIVRSGNATVISYFEDGVEISQTTNVQAGKRYSVVFNKTSTTTFIFGVGASSDTLGDIVLSRPQVEQGLVATDYIETGASTAQAGVLEELPRINYSGSTPSLLLEPSRTNLVTNSEYLEGYNQITNLTLDLTNETLSPEGLNNSYSLTSTSTSCLIRERINPLASGTYTFSFYAKYDSSQFIAVRNSYLAASFDSYVWFDILNKTKGTTSGSSVVDYDIEDVGNGWVRCYVTTTSTSSGDSYFFIYFADSDGGLSTTENNKIYSYGWQVEEGSYPTSYIPTYGTVATRGADVCDRGSNLAYTGAYTLFMEFELTKDAVYLLNSATGTSYSLFLENDDTTLRFDQQSGGSTLVQFQNTFDWSTALGTTIKIAFTKSGTTASMFVNGTKYTPSSNALSTGNEVLDWRYLNYTTYPNRQEQAYIKQLLEFEEALSDAECITLTTL